MSTRAPAAIGLVLGLLVGVVGSVAVVRMSTAASTAMSTAASTAALTAASTAGTNSTVADETYAGDPEQEARLVQSEGQRLVYVRTVASTARWNPAVLDAPYRVRTGAGYTLVLPARAAPYTVADLLSLAPDTFVRQADGAYLLSESVLVLAGAALLLRPDDGSEGLTLRLASDESTFVSIVSDGGTLTIEGRGGAPVTIDSWNPGTGKPDLATSDGRAYLRVIGGSASISHTRLADLGFWSGNTGGLALTGTDAATGDEPTGEATGDVTGDASLPQSGKTDVAAASDVGGAQILQPDAVGAPATVEPDSIVSAAIDDVSTTGNAFGLFVAGADGVVVRDSRFEDSLVDGLVFHRAVTNSAVRHTQSVGNAIDGIRVSRASSRVAFADVTAAHNGRDGFVIDGRPLARGPSATGTAVETFGDNRVTGSSAIDNGRYGIAVTGGRDITLSSNIVKGNETGIVVADGAERVDVVANRVTGQSGKAIAVRDGVTATSIATNRISGGETAVYVRDAAATVEDNAISDIANHGVTLLGDVSDATVARNAIAGFGNLAIFDEKSTGGIVGDNDTLGWRPATTLDTVVDAIFQPLTIVWIVIALVVLATALSPAGRRATSIRHPYAERVPLSSFTKGIVSRESIREVDR